MSQLVFEQTESDDQASGEQKLPLLALIALALSGFITILTEALPAGLLPQISADLAVSQSATGQTVTIYALGSLLAAIPLTRATQGLRRRPLLTLTIIGFAIANLVTALSLSYVLTMVARGLAGISAGLLWALLAGYAARLVPDHQKGRAIAIAMAGTPIALYRRACRHLHWPAGRLAFMFRADERCGHSPGAVDQLAASGFCQHKTGGKIVTCRCHQATGHPDHIVRHLVLRAGAQHSLHLYRAVFDAFRSLRSGGCHSAGLWLQLACRHLVRWCAD